MHLILVLVVLLKLCKSEIPVSLFHEVIEYYGKATTVSTFFCNRNNVFNFMKEIGTEHQVINLALSPSSLFYPIPPQSMVYILDLQCNNTADLIFKADKYKLFSTPFKWIIYHNSRNDLNNLLIDYFNETKYILVDSDVTFVIQNNEVFDLWKIFRRHTREPIITEYMGNWTEKFGFVRENYDEIISRRRKNLRGVMLNTCIVITHEDSLNHLTDKRDIHIDSIAKVDYVLVEHLSDIINASLNYSVRTTWGYKDNNSNWSGMIGELTRREADIGGTALFLTADRIHIIDYIAMVTPTRSKFIFRQPKLSYVANVFTLPFDIYVWISTIALLIVTAFILYITVRWEWAKKDFQEVEPERNVSNEAQIHNSWIEVFFITFGALCQQSTNVTPYSIAGRIVIIFLFMSLMFLYTSYSANIVALLQSSSTSIQTLEDILKSRLDVGVDDTVFNHFYFPTATEPIRKALYQQKVAPPGQKPKFYPIEVGIKKMRQGLFAFHVETGPGYKLVSETFHEGEKCGLKEIPFLQVPDPWLAIQKNSSYKKMLKVGLHQLQENGIQSREVGLIYTRKPQCLSSGSTFINVGLVDCYPALVVLCGGIAVSILMWLIELYVHARLNYYSRKRKRRIQEKIIADHIGRSNEIELVSRSNTPYYIK